LELAACIHLRKTPLDCFTRLIALLLPSTGCVGQRLLIGKAAIETLVRQRRQLDFGPIAPTALFRCIVPCKLLSAITGLLRWQGLIERPRPLGVQGILDEANPLSRGRIPLPQGVHKLRILHRGPSGADVEVAQPPMRITGQQHPAGAMAFIFLVSAPGAPRLHRQGQQDVPEQLTGALVKADQRP
jgi:hypothetical protein